MFCEPTDLATESDVEQKLLWPLLTNAYPTGMGYKPSEVATKPNLRRLEIGKGNSRKLYYPDYVTILSGLPFLVIEAKAPSDDLERAMEEARMYAAVLNAKFPPGTNPVRFILACNGSRLRGGSSDSEAIDFDLSFAQVSLASPEYATLIEQYGRKAAAQATKTLRAQLAPRAAFRALSLVGGETSQKEELAPNSFGATIAADFGHLFSPNSTEDRLKIVRDAYVPSQRRQRFIEPIDRIIRNAIPPAISKVPLMEDTSQPSEITRVIRERRNLENQIMILVGGAGAGKSTFVDYISNVALPADVRQRTVWVRVDLNNVPLLRERAYDWISESIITQLIAQHAQYDFSTIEIIEKVFAPEIAQYKKGEIQLLPPGSDAYQTRLSDHIRTLRSNQLGLAKAIARFVCAGPGKLLVICLDNCDKRSRDDQLLMFQVAQWVQREFKALIILPIRDVTYDLHRGEPPLDTTVKGLTFRIEAPPFAEVLQKRVMLAINEINENQQQDTLSYETPNGIRIKYPASDQGYYLATILRSLWAHDRFVRQVLGGIAGRDVRRCLEIFLDFCTSGHIGEDEIFKIRHTEGGHILPAPIVANALLRMHRRHYSETRSYIKNLVQSDPSEETTDHFVRLSILKWFSARQQEEGPAGTRGFHRYADLLVALIRKGHASERIRTETLFLVKEKCLTIEHLQDNRLDDGDLISIAPSGVVHLQLMVNADYLAACAEDTWVSERDVAERVALRMRTRGTAGARGYARLAADNAREFVDYLHRRARDLTFIPDDYFEEALALDLGLLKEAEGAIESLAMVASRRCYVGNLPFSETGESLKPKLKELGFPVESCDVPRNPNNPSHNKGYAFVVFADHRTALRALDTAVPIELGGRKLKIDEAAGDDRRQGLGSAISNSRLYVAGLPLSATEELVRSIFAEAGFQLSDVFLPGRTNTARGRIAFVGLLSPEELMDAIAELNGREVHGHHLLVRPAHERKQRRDSNRHAARRAG